VVAVTGTITVEGAAADGWVELNPTGDAAAGVVAAEAGTSSSGGFTAALDAEGDLVLEASVGADVVVEVSGYFTPPPVWTMARNYWPATPTTIGSGGVAAGTTNVTVTGVGEVPATGVSAVTVTVLTSASGAGSLRFAPNGAASAGTVAWDAAFPVGSGSYTVPVNPDGTITVEASVATTLLGFSVTGYWAVPTGGDVGLGLELLDGGPTRVLDTTTGAGTCVPSPCDTVLSGAAPMQVTVAGVAGVPADADAVLVSVAATGAGYGIGSVSSSEAGGNVALLAFDAGIVASASVIVPVDDDGTIDLTTLYTNAEFTIDVVGHFAQPSTTVTYAYGADGLRTSATQASGFDIDYTWSAAIGLPLLLAEHRGTATSYLVYGPGGAPLYQVTAAGQPVYFHLDHLGSVRHTTAANGANRGTLTYSAYGEITANTTNWIAEQPLLGYAGEYHDPVTGFIYLRARHYDPTTGQFLTRDPLEALTREPYGYAAGNPANATDPTGMFPVLVAAWAAFEVGMTAWDAYQTYRSFTDECAGTGERLFNLGALAAGFILPGGGYSGLDDGVEGAARILPTELTVGRNAETGVDVYQGISGGAPVYSGITNDLLARANQHGSRFDDLAQVTTSSVTRGEARAIEEALIVRDRGQNLRHEISPRHPWYNDALAWGEDWLTRNGF
jgi:RHS repeat-associated protein